MTPLAQVLEVPKRNTPELLVGKPHVPDLKLFLSRTILENVDPVLYPRPFSPRAASSHTLLKESQTQPSAMAPWQVWAVECTVSDVEEVDVYRNP